MQFNFPKWDLRKALIQGIAILALWSLLTGLLGFWLGLATEHQKCRQRAAQADFHAVSTARTADTKAAETHSRESARVNQEIEADQAGLEKAIASNSAWADQPLPADVAERLRQH